MENKENLHLYFSNEECRNTNWQNSSDRANRKQRRTKSLFDLSEEIFKSRFPVLLDNRKNQYLSVESMRTNQSGDRDTRSHESCQ